MFWNALASLLQLLISLRFKNIDKIKQNLQTFYLWDDTIFCFSFAGPTVLSLPMSWCWPRRPQRLQDDTSYCYGTWMPIRNRYEDLILQASHTLDIGHRKIKMDLNWKLHACWLAFMMLECDMQAVKAEKSSVVLPSWGHSMLQYQPARQYMPTG